MYCCAMLKCLLITIAKLAQFCRFVAFGACCHLWTLALFLSYLADGEVFFVFSGLVVLYTLGLNGIIFSVQYYYSYVRCRSFMLTESSLSFSITWGPSVLCYQLWLVAIAWSTLVSTTGTPLSLCLGFKISWAAGMWSGVSSTVVVALRKVFLENRNM